MGMTLIGAIIGFWIQILCNGRDKMDLAKTKEIAIKALEQIKRLDKDFEQPIVEVPDIETANLLVLSEEYCQPKIRKTNDNFCFIRRKK